MTRAVVLAALATTIGTFAADSRDEVSRSPSNSVVPVQDQAPNRREVTIVAREFQFVPNRVEVARGDLVRVHLTSDDRPYSFAIDAYRIVKRAGARQTIVFDFRADQAGTFTFYCNLTSAPQCKEMKGTLVVKEK
jgi:cytochrome c oxidase subunit II